MNDAMDIERIKFNLDHFTPCRNHIERQKDGSFVCFGLSSFSGEFTFLGCEPNFQYAKKLLLDEYNELLDYVTHYDARTATSQKEKEKRLNYESRPRNSG